MENQSKEMLNTYALYHQNPINKLTHYLGIPLIVFATIGLLHFVGWQHLNAATVLILIVSIYYARAMDLKVAALFLLIASGFYVAASFLSLPINAGIFIFGWVLQLIGHHYFEKKKPAFLENFEHLLIGPAWLIQRMIRF